MAARQGGGNPDDNPRLRGVIDKALTANMKKDTIERAVERGAGDGDDSNYEELTYEGYGPGGVAIFVEVMTDNRKPHCGRHSSRPEQDGWQSRH